MNTEVLSRVIEVIAGMSFDQFVHQRVLDPLRMSDTDFSVPASKRSRIVAMTSTDEAGRLVVVSSPAVLGERLKRYPSGAGGLYSTGNYQSLINAALREHITHQREPLEATLRRVLREELRKAG